MASKVKRSNSVGWVLAIVLMLIAAVGVFWVVSNATAQSTYYVLNQDVAARTKIEPSMLMAVEVNKGAEPRNSLGVNFVANNEVWSKSELRRGDVLSLSVVSSGLDSIGAGLPGNFVVTSFEVPPERAVAGGLKRGDYVDILAVSEGADGESVSKFILRRVLVLDVSGDLEKANRDGVVGVTKLYTVGVSAEDAAVLALVHDLPLFLVLSSGDDVEGGAGERLIRQTLGTIFGVGGVGDSGVGTDPLFVAPGDGSGAGSGVEVPAPAPSSSVVLPEEEAEGTEDAGVVEGG